MIKLRDDIVFEDPQSRIREYCEIEIYRGYDDKRSVNNNINRSMHACISHYGYPSVFLIACSPLSYSSAQTQVFPEYP